MSDKESKADGIDDKCLPCKGTGSVLQPVKRDDVELNPSRCPQCNGTGRAAGSMNVEDTAGN